MFSSTECGAGRFGLKVVHSQRNVGLQNGTLSTVFERGFATLEALGRAIGGLRLEQDVGSRGRGVFWGGGLSSWGRSMEALCEMRLHAVRLRRGYRGAGVFVFGESIQSSDCPAFALMCCPGAAAK